jgi:hypothetical protein
MNGNQTPCLLNNTVIVQKRQTMKDETEETTSTQKDNRKKRAAPQSLERSTSLDTIEETKVLISADASNRGILARYNFLLDRYPVQTKSATAAAVQGLGAGLASILKYAQASDKQRRKDKLPIINWPEVIAFALHGMLIQGPVSHYW